MNKKALLVIASLGAMIALTYSYADSAKEIQSLEGANRNRLQDIIINGGGGGGGSSTFNGTNIVPYLALDNTFGSYSISRFTTNTFYGRINVGDTNIVSDASFGLVITPITNSGNGAKLKIDTLDPNKRAQIILGNIQDGNANIQIDVDGNYPNTTGTITWAGTGMTAGMLQGGIEQFFNPDSGGTKANSMLKLSGASGSEYVQLGRSTSTNVIQGTSRIIRNSNLPLVALGAAVNLTNSTAELTALSTNLPGGWLGAKGAIRFTAYVDVAVTNTGNCFVLFKVGSQIVKQAALSTANQSAALEVTVFARNSETSQVCLPDGAQVNSATSYGTFAGQSMMRITSVDMTVNQTLAISLSNQNAASSLTLEGGMINVFPSQ